MKNRAPWELLLINLYLKTGAGTGRLSFGNFHYYRKGDFLVLNAGSSWTLVHLDEI